MDANTRKLAARYQNGFTKHEAVCRNLNEERRLIAAKGRGNNETTQRQS
jgi:hypothetical protein